MVFKRSGDTRAVALDISKGWHAGLLHKFQALFLLLWLRVVLDGKSSQEYQVNAGVPRDSILGPTLFLLYINDLPDDVICNIAIYANDATL